jgi:tRNA (cmo5U34)-methyltransferase
MSMPKSAAHFDKEKAEAYDQRFAKVSAFRDSIQLASRIVLSDIPPDSQVLCVGAGTGSELIYFADANPRWQFTVVEPAPAMMEICRRKANEHNITERCTFHDGVTSGLPTIASFDAATSLLVSQFLLKRSERESFFRDICVRLKPGGLLVTADLATGFSAEAYPSLLNAWKQMWRYSGQSENEIEQSTLHLGTRVAVLSPVEISDIIESAGFEPPTLFVQCMLIHAWFARR